MLHPLPSRRRTRAEYAATFVISMIVGYLIVAMVGCASAPPNLSPAAKQAFTNTRIIKGLDILRDTAIAANAEQPPALSTAVTRKVVQYHDSSLKIIHATSSGWKSTVQAGLDELLKDLSVPDRKTLAPYVSLVNALLSEVN